MKFLIAFLFLLIANLVQGILEPEISLIGDSSEASNRIIDGWPAAPNQFPWQVQLKMVSPTGVINSCGGSLISPTHVLTAAHCAIARTYMFVRLGNVNLTTPGLVLESKNFTVHPLYNPNTLNNDVALINLGRAVPVSDSIRPIRLPSRSSVNKTWVNSIATVSGWGLTSDGGTQVSETLNFVYLKVISNDVCADDYGSTVIINSTICTVGTLNEIQSTCSGDSGGPLVLAEEDGIFTQIGIVSFGSSAGCEKGYPSGYVRPDFFLDWIASFVSDVTIRP